MSPLFAPVAIQVRIDRLADAYSYEEKLTGLFTRFGVVLGVTISEIP